LALRLAVLVVRAAAEQAPHRVLAVLALQVKEKMVVTVGQGIIQAAVAVGLTRQGLTHREQAAVMAVMA
jgi:hypothetical protein